MIYAYSPALSRVWGMFNQYADLFIWVMPRYQSRKCLTKKNINVANTRADLLPCCVNKVKVYPLSDSRSFAKILEGQQKDFSCTIIYTFISWNL